MTIAPDQDTQRAMGRKWGLALVAFYLSIHLASPAVADDLPAFALPGISRGLTSDEIDQLAELIVNDIQIVDPKSGEELLSKLQRGQIRVMNRGYGFTNPINGRIAMTECFFTAAKTYRLLHSQILKTRINAELWRKSHQTQFSKEQLKEETQHRLHPFDQSFVVLKPGRTTTDWAWRAFFSSLLVHENVHLRQGRRYLKVGAIAVAAASNLSSIFGGINPAEIEAYDTQSEYLSNFRDYAYRNRNLSRQDTLEVVQWIDVLTQWTRQMIATERQFVVPAALAFKPEC